MEQQVKDAGWESLGEALDGPEHSRYHQNTSGHVGYDPCTLRKSDFPAERCRLFTSLVCDASDCSQMLRSYVAE